MTNPMIFSDRSTSEFPGCFVTNVKRYPPAPKVAQESIPYKDGEYNFSLQGGRLFYCNSTIVYTLVITAASYEQAAKVFEQVQQWLYSGTGMLTDGFMNGMVYTNAYCLEVSEAEEIGLARRTLRFDVTMTADPFPTAAGEYADVMTQAAGANGKAVINVGLAQGVAVPFTAVYTGTAGIPTDWMTAEGVPSVGADAFFIDVTLPTKFAAAMPTQYGGGAAFKGEQMPSGSDLQFFKADESGDLIVRFTVREAYTAENVAQAKAVISHAGWYLGDKSYSAVDYSKFAVYTDFAESVGYNGGQTVPNVKFTLREGANVVTVTGIEGINYTLTYDGGIEMPDPMSAVSLTQAEYNALGVYDSDTLYYIVDADPPKVYKGSEELTGGGGESPSAAVVSALADIAQGYAAAVTEEE